MPGPGAAVPPRLIAGTSNPLAGDFSSFTLKLDRDDGDQFLGDLNFRMPPGFTGSLRGHHLLPGGRHRGGGAEDRAVPSRQPELSGIELSRHHQRRRRPGRTSVPRGRQDVLRGPFKGAPLSLVAITPALAGPYDYGVVVVRVALHVDP